MVGLGLHHRTIKEGSHSCNMRILVSIKWISGIKEVIETIVSQTSKKDSDGHYECCVWKGRIADEAV
jgi:hypothetical protein